MALVMFSFRLLMLLCEAEEAVTPVWGPRLLDISSIKYYFLSIYFRLIVSIIPNLFFLDHLVA